MNEDNPEEPVDWPQALEAHRPRAAPAARQVPRTHQLCRELVRVLQLDGAAVAMITDTGERDLVHATDPVIAHLDELQFTLAEGPCLDAYATRTPVELVDLRGGGARWPVFAREAVAAGAAAVFAYPLVTAAVCFGVLELYRRTPGALGADAAAAVTVAVEAITRVALDELLGPEPSAGAAPHSWPARLSAAHATVHQAGGMVAVQLGVSVENAMARLRALAYSENTSLTELASRVLAGTARIDKDTPS